MRTASRELACCGALKLNLGLALTKSVMVGDRCTDIAAANAAGMRQAFLIGAAADCPGQYLPIASLAGVEAWLKSEVWLQSEV